MAREKLSIFIGKKSLPDKLVFSQSALNRFLQEKEHNTNPENKITTGGNYKEPNIFFDWTDDSKTDIVLTGKISGHGKVNSKAILHFLGLPRSTTKSSAKTKRPQQKTVLMTAHLFGAKSQYEYNREISRRLPHNNIPTNTGKTQPERTRHNIKGNKSWYTWKHAITIEDDVDKKYEMYYQAMHEFPNSHELMHSFAQLNYELEKYDIAKEYFIKSLKLKPDEPNYNSNYGLYLHAIEGNFDLAEYHFQKAAKLAPRHINNNSHYAYFLHTVRKNYDLAEQHYKIAIEMNPESYVALTNYGMFLVSVRFDISKAEELYKQALAIHPYGADISGNYATMLTQWGMDLPLAEKYFKAALKLDPTCPFKNGNYAQLLFIENRTQEALDRVEKARKYIGNEKLPLLEAEFYMYAHNPDKMDIAEKNIKKMLKAGITSYGWNLSGNIKAAIKNKHPYIKKLVKYATEISECAYDMNGNFLAKKN